MSTLFVSHSSKDGAGARELERRLARQGHHSTFLDLDPEKGIVAGQSWERTLYRKLRACRAVIALCTDHYLGSHWCFAEIALARMEGKHIIALLLDPLGEQARMPAILTDRQLIDLRDDAEEGYRRLWKGLAELDVLGVEGDWDPKKPPYLGLRAYQEEHAPVYFGREDESRMGVELLDRGAPGLVLVLGASGCGKSSLARAGIVPRLRSQPDRWLVVDPFRPRRDPTAELTESLLRAYRRYAPDHAGRPGTRELIRQRLAAGVAGPSTLDVRAEDATGHRPQQPPGPDERLLRLLAQLEDLRRHPPAEAQPPLLSFLDWGLDDLKRICGEGAPENDEPGPAQTTPLVEIADHLRRVSGRRDARVLLVIDQLEELLGSGPAEERMSLWLTLVRASLETEHSPLVCLATMRSDFLGLFQRHPALRGVDFESLSLGPMSINGLRQVIEEPARLGAIRLEAGLADRLLADTETPDALPLLSFTLWVLWRDHVTEGELGIRGYAELGGLEAAVAGEADAVLAAARRRGKEDDLRRAFLLMARLTEDGSYARQPVSCDRPEIERVQPIFDEFERRRLMVTRMDGETRTVEVAHEALFRSWRPLRSWLDDNRADLLLRQQVRRDALTWRDNHRPADNLWRGGRLQQARELLQKSGPGGRREMRSVEVEFVRAGVRRRLVRISTLAAAAILVFVALTALWLSARAAERQAEAERALAESRRLAAHAETALTKPGRALDLAALLAVESAGKVPTPEGDQALRSALARLPRRLSRWRFPDQPRFLALSADAARLAVIGADGALRILDAGSGEEVTRIALEEGQEALGAVFSPDGRRLAAHLGEPGLRIWELSDPTAPEPVSSLPVSPLKMTFSPDGSHLAVALRESVQVWSIGSSAPTSSRELTHGGVVALAFSRNGRHLAAIVGANTRFGYRSDELEIWEDWEERDGASVVLPSRDAWALAASGWTGATGGPGVAVGAGLTGVTVRTFEASPASRVVASWDVAHGVDLPFQLLRTIAVAASQDGRRLAVATGDAVQVWELSRSGRILEVNRIFHDGMVLGVAFTAAGDRLVTASAPGAIEAAGPSRLSDLQVWEATGHRGALRSSIPGGLNRMVSLSPDLEYGGAVDTFRKAWIWNLAADRPVGDPLEGVDHLALSPDGELLATAGAGCAQLWRAWRTDSPQPLGDCLVPADGEPVSWVRFGADGRFLATRTGGVFAESPSVQVWDLSTGEEFRFAGAFAAAVGHRGEFVALLDREQVQLRRLNGDPVGPSRPASLDAGAVFGPEGRLLAFAEGDTIHLLDVTGGGPPHELRPPDHQMKVTALAFSRDARYLASGTAPPERGQPSAAEVWNVAERRRIASIELDEEVELVALAEDGRYLATAVHGSIRLWLLRPDDLIGEACSRLDRNLTEQEWRRYLGEAPYQETCGRMDGQE